MVKNSEFFFTKICYFIEKTIKKSPLVIRTVLGSKYDEKMGNYQRKNNEMATT